VSLLDAHPNGTIRRPQVPSCLIVRPIQRKYPEKAWPPPQTGTCRGAAYQRISSAISLAGTGLQELMREMLVRLGEDPERDGLRDTPQRMERSMQYLTKGYQENPEEILLGAMFDVAYDEMVIVKDIVLDICA
jgi:hypothetical protein